jgi:glycosyltransferase involved in cell wall biosynthesis
MKKRILFSGEASWLSTGFAVYNRELITRMHQTGKYEIAELACYGRSSDPRAQSLPWKVYGILPENAEEERLYKSNQMNQFGVYKFDAIVADFQPDIVFDARDPWMVMHITKSRFKDNFQAILTPTVDSAPYKKEWLDEYRKAEVVCTYSNYGKRIMEMEKIKVSEVLSPGVNLDIFKPMDKKQVRADWGVNKDLLVIGTVMRNQKRKLFPDLFEAYASLRAKHRKVDEVQRSVLLCHTSWPDLGWDIPELLYRAGVQRHVIFTYKCDACKNTFFSWFIPSDAAGNAQCIFCGKMSAKMPSTFNGVDETELAEIYNIMDVYVQPAICEGWALPIVEAKACGVPGLYSNYSAMEDHVENGGGLGIKIGKFFTESETMAIRSYPDHDDMVAKMLRLLTSRAEREKLGVEARKVCEKMHTWELTAKKLESVIDGIVSQDRARTWNKRPALKISPSYRLSKDAPAEEFVIWCYRAILGREPDEKGFKDWMASLAKGTPREDVENYFRNEIDTHNRFEEIRWLKSMEHLGINPNEGIAIKSERIGGIYI